jgi:hypothetical protein
VVDLYICGCRGNSNPGQAEVELPRCRYETPPAACQAPSAPRAVVNTPQCGWHVSKSLGLCSSDPPGVPNLEGRDRGGGGATAFAGVRPCVRCSVGASPRFRWPSFATRRERQALKTQPATVLAALFDFMALPCPPADSFHSGLVKRSSAATGSRFHAVSLRDRRIGNTALDAAATVPKGGVPGGSPPVRMVEAAATIEPLAVARLETVNS